MSDAPRPFDLTRLGWGVALPVIFLICVGLASIRATDRAEAAAAAAARETSTAPAGSLARLLEIVGERTARQVLYALSGLALFVLVVRIGYRHLGRYSWWIYAAVVSLLALLVIDRYLVDLPFIPEKRATHRWIQFGQFTLQPSEFMKLALVLALAHYLRYRSSYRTWRGLIPPFLLTVIPMFLILKQPDLGTLLMLLPVLFSILFVAGAKMAHLATIILLGIATGPLFYYAGMHDYQKQRVEVLLKQGVDDEQWHKGPGYQLRQSKIALGTGGATGLGWGQGAFVEYGLLPEEHNDFIFAIIGNQWGFVGCCLVILAYIAIVIVGLEVAMVTNDPYGRLLAVGIVAMIVAQALLNMCMTIGLAPITGMPLPFVSAGGSSLWTNMIALGLLVSVARLRPLLIAKQPFEHEDD